MTHPTKAELLRLCDDVLYGEPSTIQRGWSNLAQTLARALKALLTTPPESQLREALQELVELKDLKDGCTDDDGLWMYDQAHADYKRRKPIAWERARQALSTQPQDREGWQVGKTLDKRNRFFIEHGVIHDHQTGRHVCTGEHPDVDLPETCLLLNMLWRQAHDFPRMADFYSKHALGDKVEPSCLRCGQQRYQQAVIKHLELPNIYLCDKCVAPQPPEQSAQQVTKREHVESEHCWCSPTLDYVADNGNKVWVHHEPT